MFGRKAILHTARAGKRKWQLEQEKGGSDSSENEFTGEKKSRGGPRKLQLDDDADDDRGGSDAELSDEEEGLTLRKEARPKAPKAATPDERQQAAAGAPEGVAPPEGPPDAQQPAQQEPKGEEEAEDSEEGDEDAGGSGGQKRKRFAWMDSEDEVSEGEEEEAGAEGGIAGRSGAANVGSTTAAAPAAAASLPGVQAADAPQFPPLPPANLAGLSGPVPPMPAVRITVGGLQTPLLQSVRPGMLRPSLRPPSVLPPGTRLPKLTQEHLALMAQISVTRNIDELWDVVNMRSDEFAAAHAALSLFRLSLLTSATNGASSDTEQQLEKHSSFVKLSNRVDELFATAEGRASFLPADLAMVASALAKLVQAPATEGALGRIFADVADEVETRISVEPAAFTPPMLGDLAWGVSRSGETTDGVCKAVISPAMRRFFGAVIEAAQPRLPEMTCQDLANFAGAYADATREDADELLRGIFDQTTQRLAYHPPPTNALFSASVVPGQPPVLPAQPPSILQPGVAPLRPAIPLPPPAMVPTPGGLRPAMPPSIASAPTPAPVGSAADASEVADNGSVANADDKSKRAAPIAPAKEKPPQWQQSGQWKFTGTQISEIASAVSKHINLYEPGLFDLVAKQFLQRLQEFTTNELRKLRDAFDTVRHDRDFEFLRSMKMILKQREVRRPVKAYR